MRGNTLVTGGSDGSVRVWSLETNACVHRLAAHDNSVTSLQFDETRIVSGGSDGRVKVWDLRMGTLVRELSSPAEAVWRVAFEDEKAVILAMRATRTIMEVCGSESFLEQFVNDLNLQVYSFSPPPEALNEYYPTSGSGSDRSSTEFEPENACDTVMDEEGAFIGMEA